MIPDPPLESAALPVFRYHPDPLATGSVAPSDAHCRACGQARGYIYTGPVYAVADLSEALCPWCIADGTAHRLFDAEFTDAAFIGGDGAWDEVPIAVQDMVAYQTPGFTAWQQEQWFTHCGDAAAFLGPMGQAELRALGPQAVAAVKAQAELTGAEWKEYFQALDREDSPTAYMFRCLHCGALGGYSDSD